MSDRNVKKAIKTVVKAVQSNQGPQSKKGPNNRSSNRRRRTRANNIVDVVTSIPKTPRTPRVDATRIENIVLAMEHVPRTAAGAAFVRYALNPCGEDPLPAFVGIPDSSGADAVPLSFRDDFLLEPPVDPTEPEELWRCIIFNTPYFHVHYIAIRFFGAGPSALNLQQALNALTGVQQDTIARYPNWFTIVSTINAGGTGLTPYLGPPFDVTFMVPAALNSFTSSVALPVSSSWNWFRKWRYVGKGSTMHLNAPALANQARVISAATSTESSVKNLTITGFNSPVAARYSVSPLFSDNILAMQDVNAHQDLAKKGEYTIQRHCNSSIIWNEAEDVRAIWRVPSALTTGVDSAAVQIIPSSGFQKVDGFDMNMGWIVQNVRGISQQASLHIKTRSVIAVTAPGDSPWSPVMKPTITADAPALVLYRELCARLPHSFVSDYNDWGLLSGTILRCIAQVAAPLARTGLQKGFNALNGFVDRAERDYMPVNASRGGYGDRRFGSN